MSVVLRLRAPTREGGEPAASETAPAPPLAWAEFVRLALAATSAASAVVHWEAAAQRGCLVAGVEFARLVLCGKPTPAGADVARRALAHLDAACAASGPSAMLLVARLLRRGRHVRPNPALARRWLERAAAAAYAPALHELGLLFADGAAGRVDDDDDHDDQESGFDDDDADEEERGAIDAERDAVFPRSLVVSLRCLKRAAALNFAPSYVAIARLFMADGTASAESIERARHFLALAVAAGLERDAAPLLQLLPREE